MSTIQLDKRAVVFTVIISVFNCPYFSGSVINTMIYSPTMATCNDTIIVYFDEYSLPAGVEELVPLDIREVPFMAATS